MRFRAVLALLLLATPAWARVPVRERAALAALYRSTGGDQWRDSSGWLGRPYLQGPLWHAHEMLFGFTLAVVVGFLFTAGRNWANRPTPTGWPLAALALLWVAGRVLVLTHNFAGWERGGAWNDFSFSDSDASIERMAIVGDRKWEDLALMFTAKGLRAFPIEFFAPEQVSAAQDWLAARQ